MVSVDRGIRAELVEVIGASVVPQTELSDRLRAKGHRLGQRLVNRQIQIDTSFVELADGVAHVPSLLDGVALSLPIDPDEAADNFVRMHPWLDPIGWWLIEDSPELLDSAGERIGTLETDSWYIDDVDTDVVLGPGGWLDGLGGHWVSLRVTGEGVVVEELEGPPVAERGPRAQAIAEAFERVAERYTYICADGGGAIEVGRAWPDHLLLEAVAADPAVFRGTPVAGLYELYDAAGLRCNGSWVVPADIDSTVVDGAMAEWQCMARLGIDDGGRTVVALVDLIGQHDAGAPDALGPATRERELTPSSLDEFLRQPKMARAVATELWHQGLHEQALAFATTPVDAGRASGGRHGAAPGAEATWGLDWLAAHCHLAVGEIDRAFELLERVPANEESLPLLIDRALVQLERSDGRSARRLLDRAQDLLDRESGVTLVRPHYSARIGALIKEIDEWAPVAPKASVGRNEKCPCGSGRKYKACHLGRELIPVEDRAPWLEARMGRYVEAVHFEWLDQLIDTMTDAMGSPEGDEPLPAKLVAIDVALHEGGLINLFLEGRQATLLDDEADLVRRWQQVERRVYEVEHSWSGQMDLRELVTGKQVAVTKLGGPIQSEGTLVVGRPLPVGDTHRAFGGFISVRPELASDLTDVIERGDVEEIMGFMGTMHRHPLRSGAVTS